VIQRTELAHVTTVQASSVCVDAVALVLPISAKGILADYTIQFRPVRDPKQIVHQQPSAFFKREVHISHPARG